MYQATDAAFLQYLQVFWCIFWQHQVTCVLLVVHSCFLLKKKPIKTIAKRVFFEDGPETCIYCPEGGSARIGKRVRFHQPSCLNGWSVGLGPGPMVWPLALGP